MVKTEKKKYTKKNIANKIHKSKKNSGTAKKKAFRKSKKVGGLFTNKKQEKINNLMIKNQTLVNEFRNYKKKNQIEKMRKTKNSLMENNMEIRILNSGEKRPYEDTNELIIDTKSPLFNIPEQVNTRPSTNNKKPAQLDPLPSCWKQDFKKDKDGKYTTKRYYIRVDGRQSDQRPNSNEPCPKDVKEAKQEEKKDYETEMKNIRRKILAKEAKKAEEERARLEQRIKDAKAEEEVAKAERLKLEKAAKEKAEQEKINATWSDSDATWQESYRAGK